MKTKSYRQLLAQRCVTKLQITLLLTENVHHNQMVREHSQHAQDVSQSMWHLVTQLKFAEALFLGLDYIFNIYIQESDN